MGPFISSVTINCPLLTALPLGFAYLNPENVKELTIRPTSKWRKLDALKARETAESIIMYSKAKLEGGIVPMKALRLMVMGGPAVGKTTMVRRLMNLETVENLLSTNGVALGEVKLPNKTTLETWDFGGQAIYRITHQLFLRDYCVYAVLFRLTDPFDVSLNELKFWIESVLSRTVAKDKVKIVLIGTHADRMADKESRAILSNLHKHLIQIYGESKVFPQSMRLKWFKKANFGNKKDFEIEELKEILAEVSESIQIDAPAPLEIIRVILEEQTFKPLEKISTLHQLIYKVGEEKSIHSLMDPKQRMEFLETLDMLGYLFLVRPRRILSETSPLSVRDEEYEMAVVLDPYWIARLLATLINSFHRPEGGVIDQNQLIHRYWCEKDEQEKKDFLPEYHEDMINLLVQLHILFPLRSFSSQVPSYFIPCLLNEEEPHLNLGLDSVFGARGSEESLVLDRMIHIDSHASVPVAIMPLIIVQLMAIGEVRECWQQGCAIEIHSPSTQQSGDGPECYCIVKRSTFDASLNIWMEAVSPRVGGWWMKEIMRAMENMLEEFYHVKYRVEVLYHSGKSGLEIRDCGPCVFPLNKLYKALAQRKVNALCKEKIHCVSLQYLVPDLLIEEASSLSVVSWDDLEVVGQLGRGSFGRVLKCISVTQYQTPNVFSMSSSPSPLTLSSSSPSPSPSPSPPPSAYPTSSSSFPSKLNSPSAFSAASLRKCEYCRKKKATFYCDQCKKQFLCRSCCESSRHLKRNHSPLQLNQESKKKMKGKQAKRKKFWYAAKVLEPKIRKDSEKGEEENEEESDTLALLQKEFLLEVYTMTGLDHDNIVCLVGITQPLKNPRHGYQQNHAMVMELLGGGGLYEQINFMGMSCAEPIRNLLTTFRNAQSALLFHKLTPEKVQKPPPVKPLESLCEGALGSFQKSTESWKSRVGETFQIEIDKLRKQVICNLKVVHKALQSENFEIDRKEFDSLESGMKEVTQLMRKTAAIYAPLSWSLRLKILFDISLGLAYLHSLNPPMIHRDLKSPNVFLTRSLFQLSIDKQILSAPLAKVGDFGWSVRLLGAPCLYGGERSKTADINPTWAAPEVLVTKGKQFTEKADVYALGIIMWELLVRQMPYSLDLEIDHLVKEYILSGGRPKIPPEIFEKEESPKILEQYIQLMAQCWHQEPASRLPASLVCEKVREMMTGEAALLGEIVKGVQIPGFQQKKEDGVTRLKDQMKEEEGHPVLSQSHSLNISKFSLNELIPSKHEDIQLKVKRVLFAGLNCIWITFMNGFIGVVDVKLLKDGDLSIILCDQEDKHPMEVRAITFQTAGGYVWSGCMSGQLQVWKGEPFSKEKSYDHFEMRGWLRRVKPLMSEEVWVSLETGLLRVYLNQRFGVAEAHIPINQKTVVKLNQGGLDITCPETQNTYRFRDLKKEKKGKEFPSVVVWAKFLEQFIRMQSRSSSLLRLAVSCHNREEGGEKEKNLSSSSLFFEETLVGFLGLEPLGHSVWGLTTSFSMIEFTLKSGQESHGLHRDKLIEVKRTFSIDQATIETRFQNTSKTSITGWGKNSICLSIGNAVGSLQFDKKEVHPFLFLWIYLDLFLLFLFLILNNV